MRRQCARSSRTLSPAWIRQGGGPGHETVRNMRRSGTSTVGIVSVALPTVVAVLLTIATAAAQRPPIQEAPLPPLQRQGLLPQNLLSPGLSGQVQGQLQPPTTAITPPAAIVERPNVW